MAPGSPHSSVCCPAYSGPRKAGSSWEAKTSRLSTRKPGLGAGWRALSSSPSSSWDSPFGTTSYWGTGCTMSVVDSGVTSLSFRAIFPPTKFENETVDNLLDLLGLTHIANTPVAVLPLGLSRLVEVGRALATRPTVVLLDEPLSGLDYKATEKLTAAFDAWWGPARMGCRSSWWSTMSLRSSPCRPRSSSSTSVNSSRKAPRARSGQTQRCGLPIWVTRTSCHQGTGRRGVRSHHDRGPLGERS